MTEQAADPPDDLTDALLSIWQEVLRDRTVTVDSSFWDLGGNSLTAAMLATATRRRTGHPVSFELLTKHPSPHLLARALYAGPTDGATAVF